MTDHTDIYIGARVVYHTLGCKLNFAETATLRDSLIGYGAVDAAEDGDADLCIINTCSVTGESDQKCRQAIRRLHRRHPEAVIGVMGCYAQLQGEAISRIEGVSLVIGMEHRGRMAELLIPHLEAKRRATLCTAPEAEIQTTSTRDIHTFVPSCSRGNRTRYFLKVQDGCNYYCTYCTIPIARGRSRNGSIASLVAQAEAVAEAGGKEIVITGVNIGDFGRSTGEDFLALVKALDGVRGIERFRISSLEPDLLTYDIIDACAASRAFMPHFHIPLQSGSDAVLRLMHRHYDAALFADRVHYLLRAMPDAFIGVDVIVGTRGETADYFAQSEAFIREMPIAQLHVFPYSERPGTKALAIAHTVSPEEKRERSKRLLTLSEEKHRTFYDRYVGTARPVLWEHGEGWTDNYIRVRGEGTPNTITSVMLTPEVLIKT